MCRWLTEILCYICTVFKVDQDGNEERGRASKKRGEREQEGEEVRESKRERRRERE